VSTSDDASTVEEGYRALRTGVAVRALDRDVVRVAGPDAASYLQGQLSQDVNALGVGEGRESLLLSPQGRVDAYLRVAKLADDEFVLDVESGFAPAVIERLERFRLRTKVDIDPLDWVCTGLRGPASREAVTGHPVLRVDADWPGLAGVDLLGPRPPDGDLPWAAAGTLVCPAEAWEAARIEAGQPVLGREIDERTIAAEVGVVERTVSFTKGCFTGQELVARLDARGSNVAKRLCGVVLHHGPTGDAADLVGSAVWSRGPGSGTGSGDGDGDGKEVGRLTSAAWSPGLDAVVALAVLHRSIVPPEAVVVRLEPVVGGGGLAAEARPLPLIEPA
jgi:tRNA-modifying protein YgfZ